MPSRLEKSMQGQFVDCHPPKGNLDTAALWENYLECVRSRNRETLSTPELGAAAFTTVNMGVISYREGRALYWDAEQRKPVTADPSWAARLEERSKKHGHPNQIIGWTGGDTGSVVVPPDYQKLGGAWIDGKDPADGIARATGEQR